jgi:hypothetical protein
MKIKSVLNGMPEASGPAFRWPSSGRQRQLAFGRYLVVAAGRSMAGVQAGKERRTTGGADTRAAIHLKVARALGGHSIESRCLDQLLPVAAEIALGNVVAEDENEVRPLAFGRIGGAGGTFTFSAVNIVGRCRCKPVVIVRSYDCPPLTERGRRTSKFVLP